ncbi:hypothetical protein H0H93_008132 [Arthromyces matolae]|nr:hypothetical protein H0H93_008132 [Arthromyces matolae]
MVWAKPHFVASRTNRISQRKSWKRLFQAVGGRGDVNSRPSFRPTLSQPSQMGNFKHQSLRAGEREREKDRDRDGDKDRERDFREKDGHERLRHLSEKYDRERLLPLGTRAKERDAAPHLNSVATGRTGQSQLIPGSRRGDTRDAIKKRAGEASEDWRKDTRASRDDRPDNGRRDERARSRVRDSSRSRKDASPSRKDREREPDNDDDPRRWRDDGKRDERMAARRAEKQSERFRDRDSLLDPADRRWVAAEERESRNKRTNGRDRKLATFTDEGKDRDERRDKEREKEKEPAWMDTYIPSSSSGILGAKAVDGELDGIQAWKREKKEKEMKEQADISKGGANGTQETPNKLDADVPALDEIQIFRLLMKREEEKKKVDTLDDAHPTPQDSSSFNLGLSSSATAAPNPLGTSLTPSRQPSSTPEPSSTSTAPTLISLLGVQNAPSIGTEITKNSVQPPNVTESVSAVKPTMQFPDASRDVVSQFNPPPGSRLLAFGRSAPRSQNTPSNLTSNGVTSKSPNPSQQSEILLSIPHKVDNPRPGFSSLEEQDRPLDPEDHNKLVVPTDTNRHLAIERHTFTPPTEHPQNLDTNSPDSNNGYSTNKGSRFAKFFEVKGRDAAPIISKSPVGLVSSSPGPVNTRQEHGLNTNYSNGPDTRAMDEIYAMLSSSAQSSRGAPFFPGPQPNDGLFGPPQNNLHLLQQQPPMHTNRVEPLYESRLDDRNFVPDGMVPGLRTAPPTRNRENPAIFPDNMEDMAFNVQQRLQPQPQPQQRNFEQVYPSGPQSMYGQQGNRTAGMPLQTNHYRGGPSPLALQQNLQRLPPGLANLGGRPPHEPSQVIGMPGIPNPALHNTLPLNGSHQQHPFNGFPAAGNLGYGGGPPIRGPHQMHSQGVHMSIGGHPNAIDPRNPAQNPLLGLGGPGVGGLRNAGPFLGQQAPGGQLPPMLAMRQQQQQQQLPPHLLNHIPPPHLQQHHVPTSSQPAHDLMSLLMGGAPRE